VTPEYETRPGWRRAIGAAREPGALPVEARDYVRRIGELIECPVALVSVGAQREQTLRSDASILPDWI
jgi:adenylosuccinate synthase